jgi:aminoglycoside 6-adenylyltransferase
MELDHNGKAKSGVLGKGFKKRLPPAIWTELENTYTGSTIVDNWQALFRTMALFRKVAMEVGQGLGYEYPLDLDERVTAYVQKMQQMR